MDTATGEAISREGEWSRCRVIKEEIEYLQSLFFLAPVTFGGLVLCLNLYIRGYPEVCTIPLSLHRAFYLVDLCIL